jgi:hypothetical protein
MEDTERHNLFVRTLIVKRIENYWWLPTMATYWVKELSLHHYKIRVRVSQMKLIFRNSEHQVKHSDRNLEIM